MRESGNHKEAPVYLAIMSADPREPGNPTQLSIAPTGPRRKSLSISSSNGDSTGEVVPKQPSGTQADAKEQDENTRSAFMIMSVSPFDAEDLELSMQQQKGMSHEADSFIVEDPKLRGQSESSESDEIPKVDITKDVAVKEQAYESEKLLPLEGATNGPMVAHPVPRMFRRVNKYERGRWLIEDKLEAREADDRLEGEQKGVYPSQNSRGSVSVGRESPYSQRRRGEGLGDELTQLHSRSSSDLGGQGLDPASMGEKECHIDRSSVVGESASNLSRNTSMSSLTTAGDKSVDGDHSSDRLSQLKDESESETTYPTTLTQTAADTSALLVVSSPPLQNRHKEAPLVNTNTNTSDSGGEDTSHEPKRKSAGAHRVQTALSRLNEELKQMLEENKEITRLKGEKQKLEDENRALLAENDTLKGRITGLESQVDKLSQTIEDLNTQLQNCTTKSQVDSSDS